MHLFREISVVVLVICATVAEDIAKVDETPREERTNLQEHNQEWKIIDYGTPGPEYVPRGRRVRKRKRRPPIFPQMKEPWEEITGDIEKTNNRRRLTPVFEENEHKYERVRDPFTALQEAEERQKKVNDLKMVLKNSGGLSLSEVLQQKNLSLSELLQGNQDAISAIAQETVVTTENYKLENRNYEKSGEISSLEDSKMFSRVTKFDVVTEETTERRIFVPSSNRGRKLPMTSAKLRKVAHSVETTEIRNESDAPFKMIIDLEDITTKKTEETTTVYEKPRRVTAKEEILEILKDPVQNERLSKILQTKNMTVEELVALRERGSSQVHLADIFHNKTREPEPEDEPLIGHIQIDNFNPHNRKSKTISLVTTTPKPTSTIGTKLPYTITSFPTYKIETNKDIKGQPFFPIWQQLYPSFFSESNQQTSTTTQKIISYEEELERLEQIENALAEAANEQLKVDLPHNIYEDDDDFIALPSGVKSAILASLAIIGLSLFVFLTILVIFKWSQKQKQRLSYNGSFSGSKIRSPILEPDKRRTFKTFLSETLGKKNYYKTHLRNMSDSIWDRDEKKSYMI